MNREPNTTSARPSRSGSITVGQSAGSYSRSASCTITNGWVARPNPHHPDEILPVDWKGITRLGEPKTNYQVLPGDRIFVKANPLADWTLEDVWAYIHANDVPYHPLHDQNYPSIGCTHCTRPVMPGGDPRAGRWAGQDKTECGLHPAEAK